MSQPEDENVGDLLANMGFPFDDCRDAVLAGIQTVEEGIEWIQANRPSVETSHEEESEYEEIVDRQSPSEYESLDALSREKVSEYETLGNVRRESLSQNICDKLASMGFDVDDCRDAVQAGNKTVEDSIEWIQANRAAPVEVNQQPSIGHPENGENSENAEGGPIEATLSNENKFVTIINVNPESPATPTQSSERNKCKWDENSKHWRYRLGKLCELREKSPEKLVQGLKQIVMCTDDEFRIGAGSFGTTVYAALMTDGREVAVKELLKTGRQGKTSIQKEVDILVKLRPHDNILSYKLTEWPEGHVGYIVTELCEFTLNVWLQEDQVTRLSDEEWNREVPGLLKDLLSGLNHLHSHDPLILHRDIKPQNVLVVFHNEKTCLKLADFGISRSLDDGQSVVFTDIAGTMTWRAAEVIRQGHGIFMYKKSTDIQVCGMVGYYITSRGKHPFHASTCHYVEHKILHDDPNLSALNEPIVQDLIVSMLQPEPTDRPSAATLLRHPCFWSETKRYEFFTSIGNEPEIVFSEDPEHERCFVRQTIERAKVDVLPNKHDWSALMDKLKTRLDEQVESDYEILTHFMYPGCVTSMCQLLVIMRKLGGQLSPGAKAMLGNTKFPYRFFEREVPKLFHAVYAIIKESPRVGEDWTKRETLKTFFD